MSDKLKWYAIPAYTMKCRLYLNNHQKEIINKSLYGLRVAYNSTLHGMKKKNEGVKEKESKDGSVVHFPDFKYVVSAVHLNKLREEYPIVKYTKPAALSGINGIFQSDLKRMFSKLRENKTKKFDTGKSLPLEAIDYKKLNFISNKHPRTSMSFQIVAKNVFLKDSYDDNGDDITNKKVLYIDLGKFGDEEFGVAKIRGWNQNVRFDSNGETDFISWISMNLSRQITITISKDNCDDYWICFKFAYTYNKQKKVWQGIQVYKQVKESTIDEKVGIDVGKKHLIICSNDKAFKNGKVENKKIKANESGRLKELNRRLSRRYGWANCKFREEYKENKELKPSKRYIRTKKKISKLHRKIARKRNLYNNEITMKIVENYGFIGIESLNVTDMFKDPRTEKQKDVNSSEFIPSRYVRKTNENTADAAMGEILQMIKYKSEWYNRVCQEIGRYFPSSKRCHVCGYIKRDLTLKDREWKCPECGTVHDRDENAAIGIEIEAFRMYQTKENKKVDKKENKKVNKKANKKAS